MAKRTIMMLKAATKRLTNHLHVSDNIEDRRSDTDRDELKRLIEELENPPQRVVGEPNSPLAREAGINDMERLPEWKGDDINKLLGYSDGGEVDADMARRVAAMRVRRSVQRSEGGSVLDEQESVQQAAESAAQRMARKYAPAAQQREMPLYNAAKAVGEGLQKTAMTPGVMMQPNPYPEGSEEAGLHDLLKQGAEADWGGEMALNTIGASLPFRIPARAGEAVLTAGAARPEIAQRDLTPLGFYSHGAEAASALPQPKGTPQQMRAMLEKQGVKPEEFQWAGWDEFAAGKPSITREEAATLFKEKAPQLQESRLRSNHYTADEEGMAQLAEDAASDVHAWRRIGLSEAQFRRFQTPEARSEYLIMDVPEVLDDYLRKDLNAAKYSKYQLPGGENYREVLLTLPRNDVPLKSNLDEAANNLFGKRYDDLDASMQKDAYTEAWATRSEPVKFTSSHWDEPNVLAHMRMSDRVLPDGSKALHLEELQSDWAQKGRKTGFKEPERPVDTSGWKVESGEPSYGGQREIKVFDESGRMVGIRSGFRGTDAEAIDHFAKARAGEANLDKTPLAPYVTNTSSWVDLGLKRALREAAEGGYDRLVWTPGEAQAARYDLSKKFDSITVTNPGDNTRKWWPRAKGEYRIGSITTDKDGNITAAADIYGNVRGKNISDVFGKEIAERGLTANEPEKVLSGVDLQVGGEGMKSFYDKIVPTQLSKLLKKLDPEVKVENLNIPSRKNVTGDDAWVSGSDVGRDLGIPEQDIPEWWRNLSSGMRESLIDKHRKMRGAASEEPVLGIRITPKMRENILKGLPIYSVGGFMLTPVDYDPFAPGRAEGGRVDKKAINPSPSAAQKEAGNYAKDHVRLHGLDIAIENAQGAVRSGFGANGQKWSVKMPCHYGYIKGTVGRDKDHVDVNVGPHIKSPKAFVINQLDDKTGRFDEHKTFLGFASKTQVMNTYKKSFSDGRAMRRLGSIVELTVPEFKSWLAYGNMKEQIDESSTRRAHARNDA